MKAAGEHSLAPDVNSLSTGAFSCPATVSLAIEIRPTRSLSSLRVTTGAHTKSTIDSSSVVSASKESIFLADGALVHWRLMAETYTMCIFGTDLNSVGLSRKCCYSGCASYCNYGKRVTCLLHTTLVSRSLGRQLRVLYSIAFRVCSTSLSLHSTSLYTYVLNGSERRI